MSRPTLDAARVTLRAAGYDSYMMSGGGLLCVPVSDECADKSLAEIRQALGDSYTAECSGDSNTDADGETTEDVLVEVAS